MASLDRLDGVEPLKFDCMPDWESVSEQLKDQREWRESVPTKIGVYHAFSSIGVG